MRTCSRLGRLSTLVGTWAHSWGAQQALLGAPSSWVARTVQSLNCWDLHTARWAGTASTLVSPPALAHANPAIAARLLPPPLQVDALENITHSMCTLEFESRRASYYWLLQVGLPELP